MPDSPAALAKPPTASSEAYCPTHDLFGCPFCHGYRPDFSAVTAALDAAHYPADDPIRRAISAFDFPNIFDEHEAGYGR